MTILSSVGLLQSVDRVHKLNCHARLASLRFENATDENRRKVTVEKLRRELSKIDSQGGRI